MSLPVFATTGETRAALNAPTGNLTTAPADGFGIHPVAQLMNHGDVMKPQQGMQRQMRRTFQTLPDIATLITVLPAELLGLTIEGLDWVNQVALPMVYTTSLVTTVRKITFTKPLPGEVPTLGIARLIEKGQTEFSIASARYGIGLFLENDRLQTEEGMEDFRLGVIQMSIILKQQAAHDAMGAIMNPDPEEKAYQEMYNVSTYEAFQAMMLHERDMFGVVQKVPEGMFKAFGKYQALIKRRAGVDPDILICDPAMMQFMQYSDPQQRDYWLAGPDGPVRLWAQTPLATFKGASVYSPPVYNTDLDLNQWNNGSPMTDCQRRIGNFFRMRNKFLSIPAEKYDSALRDIKLFDECENDDLVIIKIDSAVDNCFLWNAHGFLHETHHFLAQEGGTGQFIYSTGQDEDKVSRVTRCFGNMEEDNLPPALIRGIGATACKDLTDAEKSAIKGGVQLFEQRLRTPGVGVEASYLAAKGFAGFEDAWRSFYMHMRAVFGNHYNPALDPEKCPSWFHTAITDTDERGMCTLFEVTFGTSTAVSRGVAVAQNTFTLAAPGAKPFEADAAPEMYRAAFRLKMAELASRNQQTWREDLVSKQQMALEDLLSYFASQEPEIQAVGTTIAYALYKLSYETPENMYATYQSLQTMVDAVLNNREVGGYKAGTPGSAAVTAFLNAVGLAGELVTARNVRGDDDVTLLTPADARAGTSTYLTPESGYVDNAPWNSAALNALRLSPDHFRGLEDVNLYFYRSGEKGEKEYDELHFYDDEPTYHKDDAAFPAKQSNWRRRVERLRQETQPHLRAAQMAFLAAPVRRQICKSMLQYNVHLPIDFILLRPWAGYNMSTAVLMKGGVETGQTNFGYPNVQTSQDGLRKSTNVEPTWWLGSFVRDPKRIAHMAHIYFNGSLGGSGSTFYTEETITALRDQHWIVTEKDAPSLIAIAVPYGKANVGAEDLDIRGSYPEYQTNRPAHYASWAYYCKRLGFDQMTNPFMLARPDKWRGSSGNIQTVCWQGTEYSCTTEPNKFNDRVINKGHCGPEYAGCHAIRRGVGGKVDPSMVPLTA